MSGTGTTRYEGFTLVNKTTLNAENVTVTGGKTALKLNNADAVANLTNVVFSKNNVAIDHTIGTVNIINSNISAANGSALNNIINSKALNITDTTVASEIINNDGGTLIQETAAALGVLESLGVLSFRMNGGANSQIYIYVNQIQPIRNILKQPWKYENRLLKTVAERHMVSVKMLTYLYENDFTSERRWDLLEDYFLGRIPEEVEREAEKEREKQAKHA